MRLTILTLYQELACNVEMRIGLIILIPALFCLNVLWAQEPNNTDPQAVPPPEGKVPSSLIFMGTGEHFSEFAFVVDKSKRTLSVWRNTGKDIQFVQAFPSDMGKNNGDKSLSGDHKTPEGVYFFQKRKDRRELNFQEYGIRAFTMDYPNFFDKRMGKTGYGIWLHAIPESKSLQRGSRGCVVVRNEAIEKLTPFIRLTKTPIIVQDSVNYIDSNILAQNQLKLISWLKNWRSAWVAKDIDNYMSFYSENFKSMKMNKQKWRAYKSSLNDKYKFINVEFKNPIIFSYKDEINIRFLQAYQSDLLQDFGEKHLYVKMDGDGMIKILGEYWKAIKDSPAIAFSSEN